MDKTIDSIELVPQPKSVEILPGKLSFGKQVDVIKPADFDDKLLLELGKALQLKRLKKHDRKLIIKLAFHNYLNAEAYTLQINEEGVLLKAKAKQGFFYGLQTLEQLIKFEDELAYLPFVMIEDFPTMPYRGVVEGFYGTPWTHEQRLDQIRYYGKLKMNSYIYAPKDDPYHREKWRDPYPKEEIGRMASLIKQSKDVDVDFVFAISPGLDLNFVGDQAEKDFQDIMNKIKHMYDFGVRTFAVFFDDIEDKSGIHQALFLNRIHDALQQYEDINPLITVPTEYDALTMIKDQQPSQYTQDFSSTLKKEIVVLWTGDYVVSDRITLEDFNEMKEIYGENIGIWWNYPVSDYFNKKLALGPVVKIDKRLKDLKYFYANPMEHAELSKIALGTSADLSWNLSDYEPIESWSKTINKLYPALNYEVKVWAKHSSQMNASWTVGLEDAIDVQEKINAFWSAVNTFDTNNIEKYFKELRKDFTEMVNASDILVEKLDEKSLKEGQSSLSKLKELGEHALRALDMLGALINQNQVEYAKTKEVLKNTSSELKQGMRISEKVVLRFIEDSLEYQLEPQASFSSTRTVIRPNESIKLINTSSKNIVSNKWTIFGKNGAEFTERDLDLTFENEGTYSLQLAVSNPYGHDELLAQHYIHVSNRLSDKIDNVVANAKVEASSFTNEREKPENVLEVDRYHKWCAVEKDGKYPELSLTLEQPRMVSQIKLYHAEYGHEPFGMNSHSFKILASLDGTVFKEICAVKDNTEAVTEHNFSTLKMKYIKIVFTKPTQGVENTARLYGLEVYGW